MRRTGAATSAAVFGLALAATSPVAAWTATAWASASSPANGTPAPMANRTPAPLANRTPGSLANSKAAPPVSYLSQPCTLVPVAEVQKVLQAPMGPGRPKPGTSVSSCTYITTGSDMYAEFSYALRPGSATSARSRFTGTFTSEPAIGRGAYCVVAMANEAAFEANMGTLRGKQYHLDISAQTCTYAAKLAKYALGRLS